MSRLIELANSYYHLSEEEKTVAFIDVLGFQNKVEDNAIDTSLINIIMRFFQGEAEKKLDTFFFSDCMYIIGDNLSEVLSLISCIQLALLNASKRKLNSAGEEYDDLNLIRGGITKGKVIVNSDLNILLGKAVNRAYYLESQLAIYPRVVFDREFFSSVNVDDIKFFVEDFDELLYFDFLKFCKTKKKQSISVNNAKAMQDYIKNYDALKKKTDKQSDDERIDETTANNEGGNDNNSEKKSHERIKCKLEWFDNYLENSQENLDLFETADM